MYANTKDTREHGTELAGTLRYAHPIPSTTINLLLRSRSGGEPCRATPVRDLARGGLEIGEVATINGSTFGTRVYGHVSGGNFTDCSGKLVASILPGSTDTGVLSAAGMFFRQVILNLRWAVDQKLAYLRGEGVSKFFESDLIYFHLERESETYSALNSRFLLANVPVVEGDATHPVITVFGVA